MRTITIDITHPKHGKAHCNPDQLPEFESLGWKRADAETEQPTSGKGKGKAQTTTDGDAKA